MRRTNWTMFRGALQVAVLVAMSMPTKPLLADTILDSGTTTVSTDTDFENFLVVADTGTATMEVVDGAYATSLYGIVGYNTRSVGTVNVLSGTWANVIYTSVGFDGTGTLNVTGGSVTNMSGVIGSQAGGVGTATVSSGTWATSGDLAVGNFGTGTLNVTGGHVSNTAGFLGVNAGSVGTVNVSSGTWANTGDLVVGNSGTGTLNVTGGVLTVGGALSRGTSGTIRLDSDGTLQIGTGATSGVLLGGTGGLVNNGTLIFNRSDASTHSGVISGTGRILNAGTGTTTLTGQTSYVADLATTAGRLIVGSTASVNGFSTTGGLAAASGGTLELRSKALAYVNGVSTLAGGTIRAANGISLGAGATVVGTGAVSGRVSAVYGSRIEADGGKLTAGDSSSYAGFSSDGELHTNASEIELQSRGLAYVNGVATLAGGTIRAANGISLGSSATVVGTGAISCEVSAAYGAWIEADGGKLTVGKTSSYVGFASDGRIYTNANEVELLDRNESVLGSLTQLGNGSAGGTLRAANGMLLEQGKNLTGRGTVYGNFVNQGDVYGDGPAAGQKIVFAAGFTVSGIGSFENVVFDGTYSPGNSPAITNLSNGEFSSASSLLIELGGPQPGTQYDRVVDSGVLALLGGTLDVVLYNGFVPSYGNSFEILQYGQLSGDFGTVNYPALGGGLSWERTTSATAMTITVVPEPSTYAISAIATVGLARLMRWRKRQTGESEV